MIIIAVWENISILKSFRLLQVYLKMLKVGNELDEVEKRSEEHTAELQSR